MINSNKKIIITSSSGIIGSSLKKLLRLKKNIKVLFDTQHKIKIFY
jgi:hypothetical protein|tara:strand:- start:603 stop:740 length:138 start_codon:yes stop_codon:yes gene_type:complete